MPSLKGYIQKPYVMGILLHWTLTINLSILRTSFGEMLVKCQSYNVFNVSRIIKIIPLNKN